MSDYIDSIKGLRGWDDLVIHDERSPIFALKLAGYTIVRLWLPRGIVDGVTLEFKLGGSSEVFEEDMVLVGRGDIMDYYEVWIKGDVKGYLFKLRDDGRIRYFGLEGLGDSKLIVPVNVKPYDEYPWWAGIVYYMVFLDSFDRALESKGIEYIKVLEPREHGYYGGDLQGLARRLNYIRNLGVNAIYLTPIYTSASHSFLKVPTIVAYIYQTAAGQTIFWGDFAARTILFSIPIVTLFMVSQRYIGEAMRYGAGKL